MTTVNYSKTEVDALLAPITTALTKLQTPAPTPALTPTPVPVPAPVPAPLPTPTPTPTTTPAPSTMLTAGQWTEIPNSAMQSAVYSGSLAASLHGTTGPSAIMSAWGGACLDTKRDVIMVWGGGHSDYSGNEVYGFNLRTNTWKPMSQPDSVAGYAGTSGILPNGNPASRHTYGGLAYIPATDQMFETGGAHATDGNGDTTSWLYSVAIGAWKQAMSNTTTFGAGDIALWDTTTSTVVCLNENAIARYNPATNTWAPLGTSTLHDYHESGAIAPDLGIIVTVGAGFLEIVNLKTGAVTRPTSSGDQTAQQANAPGFVYYAPGQYFIAHAGGKTLYKLDPTNWAWTAFVPSAGAIPPAMQGNGTFGRLVYDATLNMIALVNDIAQNVFAFQPPLANAQPAPLSNVVTVTHASGTVQTFSSIGAAQSSIGVGDAISLSGGVFNEGISLPGNNTLTLNGVILQNATVQGGIGLIGSNGDNSIVIAKPSVIQNVVGDGTAAGIRIVAGNLNCSGPLLIQGCDDGILGGVPGGVYEFDGVTFKGNGSALQNGLTHNVYITAGASATFRNITSIDPTQDGHCIKSRAEFTLIDASTITADADASLLIDVPNAGTLTVSNSKLTQGNTDRTDMISYGEEGATADGRVNAITLTGNTIKTTRSPSTLIDGPALPAFVPTGNTVSASSGFQWGVAVDASNTVTVS